MWLDGEFVPFDRATVHFLSPTLHYGLGIFESFHCYATERGTAAFRLREHLRWFLDSIRVLGVNQLPYDLDMLRDIICRLIRVNNLNACYGRPMMYMASFTARPVIRFSKALPGRAYWPWPMTPVGRMA